MPRITICMPSYNRGSLALKHIRWMQKRLKDVNYLVVDNASVTDTQGYAELKRDPKVRYVKMPVNTGIDGAFNACVKAANGVIVFCSDEDVIPPDGLKALQALDWNVTGIARGNLAALEGESRETYENPRMTHEKGIDAVLGYCFQHPYMSGVAYNLKLMESALPAYFDQAWKCGEYMIFFLDLLACISGNAETLDVPTALLGKVADNADDTERQTLTRPYSFGSRIDQQVALTNALVLAAMATNDARIITQGLIKLTGWSMRLLAQVNHKQYEFYSHIDRMTALNVMRDVILSNIELIVGQPEIKEDMRKGVLGIYDHALDVIARSDEASQSAYVVSGGDSK